MDGADIQETARKQENPNLAALNKEVEPQAMGEWPHLLLKSAVARRWPATVRLDHGDTIDRS